MNGALLVLLFVFFALSRGLVRLCASLEEDRP